MSNRFYVKSERLLMADEIAGAAQIQAVRKFNELYRRVIKDLQVVKPSA